MRRLSGIKVASVFGIFKHRRRERVREQPFLPEWLEILARDVPYYELLSADEQTELRGRTLVLLDEKRFEGCNGLELTDEMRITILGQAAVLLLGGQSDYFAKLDTILVYPSRYYVETEQRLPGGVVVEGVQGRLGESWYRGPVVLSWADVLAGSRNRRDGRNVVLHEFAHQLDSEMGGLDGAPLLAESADYAEWARVMNAEFARLKEAVAHRRRTFINPYGATNPAEFFAVITEVFFEEPVQLQRLHAELYGQLQKYYRQDPAERVRRNRARG